MPWPDGSLFRVLGPVRLDVPGQKVDLGPEKQRCLLAVLLLNPGQPVQVAELADRIWGDSQPGRVRNVLATYVTRLRRSIAAAGQAASGITLRHATGGYLVDCDREQVDLHRARRLLREAKASDDSARTADLYRRILADWQPVALAGISGRWAERVREGLHQQRLTLVSGWAEAELRLGRAAVVVDELQDLIAQHPTAEELAGPFMIALVRTGRPARALDCYERLRRALAEQLGADPAGELQELHRAILRRDLERDRPAAASPTGARVGPRHRAPAQLPPDVRGFAGRSQDLSRLNELRKDAGRQPTATTVCAIAGTAGVGKTALAVHWAHRMRESFPDGQLYVNLRGFDPAAAAVAPGEVIHRFLDALGVSSARIPIDVDAQASLYRSELDGRRVLLLLDNARDAEQVRPLLPGTPTALTLVTSRDRLSSLVAVDGAQPLTLDLLTDDEARQLLIHRLGTTRVAAQPGAVDEIITRCARLPLALTIAAARAAQPALSLAAVAAELADASKRLDALSAGDAVSEVRAVFSWSYSALTPAAAELFRLLGRHPGPDISAPAAASLIGAPPPRLRSPLDELLRANLLTEQAAGRYAFHDLLRVYAADLARAYDPQPRRHAAIGRLLDHYLHTAHAADRLLHPQRDPITPALAPPAPGATPETLADHAQAMAWLRAEHSVLLSAVGLAADTGLDAHTWQLAWTLTTYLTRQGPWQDLATAWQAALTAAHHLDDPSMQAQAHRHLGQAHTEFGQYHDADTHYRLALDLYAGTRDAVGKARTRHGLATLYERQHRVAEALHHARLAYALFRDAGHRHGQAATLNAIGWLQALLGNHQEALNHCRQALTRLQHLGSDHSQADSWDTLGYAHHHLHQHDQAITSYQHALRLYRTLGDRYYEAGTLIRLGDTHEAANDHAAAHRVWRQALTILNDLDHPAAHEVDTRLARSPLHHRRSPGCIQDRRLSDADAEIET